jgi:hypothetical protein
MVMPASRKGLPFARPREILVAASFLHIAPGSFVPMESSVMTIPSASRVLAVGVLVMTAAFSAACSGATTGTTPTPVTTTDTFSGTLLRFGAVPNSFTVVSTGTVTIALTDVEPATNMALGVGIGTWSGKTCTLMTRNDNARSGSTALTGTAVTGIYCVQVYDSGNISDSNPVTYTVQVVHP